MNINPHDSTEASKKENYRNCIEPVYNINKDMHPGFVLTEKEAERQGGFSIFHTPWKGQEEECKFMEVV